MASFCSSARTTHHDGIVSEGTVIRAIESDAFYRRPIDSLLSFTYRSASPNVKTLRILRLTYWEKESHVGTQICQCYYVMSSS